MRDQYILKGKRPGFDLGGLERTDQPDGYSEFRRADGTVRAIVLTCLVVRAA